MSALPQPKLNRQIFRFGVFEFRAASLELFKHGIRLKLQEQPSRVLLLLLEARGQLVTREQLQKELWPDDTFVEFDAGLNTAISKLRSALGDSTANPMFIERVPKQGYRFVAPVQTPAPILEPAFAAAPAPAESSKPGRSIPAGLLAAGAVIVLAAAGWWIASLRPARQSPPAVRFTIELPPDQTLVRGSGRAVALSPDGSAIAYLAVRGQTAQVFAKRWEDIEFQAVPGTEGATDVFFSPDGRSLVFSTNRKMVRIGLDGRDPMELASIPPTFGHRTGIWGDDGTFYFGNAATEQGTPAPSIPWMYRMRPGTPPVAIVPTRSSGRHWFFVQQLLPGGRDLLYSDAWGPRDKTVNVRSLRDGKDKVLVDPAMAGFYLPTGHLVYAWNGNLIAAPFSMAQMRVLGPGTVVVRDVAPRSHAGTQAAISNNGTLAYIPDAAGNRVLMWVDRSGHETPFDLPPAPYDFPALSPSGSRLLLTRTEAGQHVIWIYEMSPAKWTRLATGEAGNFIAIWSPDEQSVVFNANLQGERFENLYWKPVSGSQAPARVAPSPQGQFAQAWTAAQGLIYTESDRPGTAIDLFTTAMDGKNRPVILTATKGNDSHGTFSPDGRWVAYSSDISGRPEVYLQPYPAGGVNAIPVSNGAGTGPLWSPKGDELFYRTADAMWSIPFRNRRPGAPVKLFSGRYVPPGVWNREYCVSSDGSRFLMMRNLVDPEEYRQIHVVLNWSAELARLIPAGRQE